MAQNLERTRTVVRNSISRASTISAEEQQMALTEKEFSVIKKKIDKIDQRLDNLYKNWHAEYGSTTTLEECDEIKRFYKPYLEKYKSKCYVRQYSLVDYSIYYLGVIILHMIVCTVIHTCSSLGSLFFATLRQNN